MPCNLSSTCFRSDLVTVILAVVDIIYMNVGDPTYGGADYLARNYVKLPNKLDLGTLGSNLYARDHTCFQDI